MGKIAFVFSGQGAQYGGMGKSLYGVSQAARDVFDTVDIVRPGTSAQCFEGSNHELRQTKNTQPCLFAVDLAAAEALREAGIEPALTAGFSLGELSALAFSGVVSHGDGFSLVCRRGALMQEAAEKFPGEMAAVLKLNRGQVEDICSEFEHVYPVNYNAPGQTVVAGSPSDMEAVKVRVKAQGGRFMPLKVSGGFHSPFMAQAAGAFGDVLSQYELSAPRMTLYSNYTAKPYEGDMKELLTAQIENPVRWQEIIEDMLGFGVDIFVEVGPGKTLCGLISKITKEAVCYNVEDGESLNATLKGLSIC